jgi:helix-turn-helix resolvase-like protein
VNLSGYNALMRLDVQKARRCLVLLYMGKDDAFNLLMRIGAALSRLEQQVSKFGRRPKRERTSDPPTLRLVKAADADWTRAIRAEVQLRALCDGTVEEVREASGKAREEGKTLRDYWREYQEALRQLDWRVTQLEDVAGRLGRRPRPRKVTPQVRRQVRRCRHKMGVTAIARKFGLSRQTVYEILRRPWG